MSVQQQKHVAYGLTDALLNIPQAPIISNRAPTVNDKAEIGTLWVDTPANAVYALTSIVDNAATWTTSPASGSGVFTAVTVNPGNVVVTAGNVDIAAGNLNLTTGNAVIGGNLTVAGISTFTGGFVITDTAPIVLTSTSNTAGAVTLEANGGVLETILIESLQGTGNASVDLVSAVGGVTLSGGKASINAVNLVASNGAGGITASAGTAGIALTAANGPIALASGTGAILIGTDAVAHAISIGNNTGATSVSIQAGTAGAGAINIGTSANAVPIVIGNLTGASGIIEHVGAGNYVLDGVAGSTYNFGASTVGGTLTFGGSAQTGNLIIGPSTAAMNAAFANSNGAKAINIGNGISGNTIAIGNGANSSAQAVNIASGAAAAISIVSILAGNATAGVQTLNLASGTSVAGKVVHIADGASVNTVTLGSTATTSTTTIQAGSGGINLNAGGELSAQVGTDTAASPTATATVNTLIGKATFTGFTTAAGASQVFVVTNGAITATSVLLCSVTNQGTNDAQMTINRIQVSAGSFSVTLKNNGAAALNGNVIISFWSPA